MKRIFKHPSKPCRSRAFPERFALSLIIGAYSVLSIPCASAGVGAQVACLLRQYWAKGVARIQRIETLHFPGREERENNRHRILVGFPYDADVRAIAETPVGQSMGMEAFSDGSTAMLSFSGLNRRLVRQGFSAFAFEPHDPPKKDGRDLQFPESFLVDGLSEGKIRVARSGKLMEHDLSTHAPFWEIVRHSEKNRLFLAIQAKARLIRSIRERLLQEKDPGRDARLAEFNELVEKTFMESIDASSVLFKDSFIHDSIFKNPNAKKTPEEYFSWIVSPLEKGYLSVFLWNIKGSTSDALISEIRAMARKADPGYALSMEQLRPIIDRLWIHYYGSIPNPRSLSGAR